MDMPIRTYSFGMKAQDDAVALDREEVQRAEAHVWNTRSAMRELRDEHKLFDPKPTSEALLRLVASLESEVDPMAELAVHAGDRIRVMPRVDTKNLELAKGITQILYQIAVATKVAVSL